MSLINVNKLTFCYDGSVDYVFKDASFQIDTDWRTGLTGRNGRGKTTFLKLLSGMLDHGGAINSSVSFDYFPFAVKDETAEAIEVIYSIVPECELWEVQKELNKLKVSEGCLYRPFKLLSGGERTKIMLAALFAKENNFLLIDEPTNHLDAEGRRVVSNYMSTKKSFIVVSHDRAFLDACTDHILSINKAGIEVQKGNFSVWLENKEKRDSFEKAENEKLMGEINRLSRAAKRSGDWAQKGYRDSTESKSPDSGAMGFKEFHRKKAGKLDSQVKALEKRQNRAIEEKSALLKNIERTDELKIAQISHRTERLIEAKKLSAFYGGKEIFSELDLLLNNGERVSVSGKNGSGKSTLLKLLAGENIAYSGTLNIAGGLKISYVSQDTSYLKGSLTDFSKASGIDETLLMTILVKLDFSKAQFDKDMRAFSDGQKKKILIAKSLCENAHIYIWDEPLNYIDIMSRIQIEELILSCRPTMLFVEHDKAFAEKIATSQLCLN